MPGEGAKYRVQWSSGPATTKGGRKWLTDSVADNEDRARELMVQAIKKYPMSDWRIVREEVMETWPPRRAITAAVR